MTKYLTIGCLFIATCSYLSAQYPTAPQRRNPNIPSNPQRFEENNRPTFGDKVGTSFQGANGKYRHDWALPDGSKGTTFFDYGGLDLRTSANPARSSRTAARTEERNRQTNSDGDWDCVTKEVRIALDNDDFLTVDNLDQSSNIYPGAIYKFENYVNGSWLSETEARNPFIISTAALGVEGEPFQPVNAPTKSGIRSAVNALTGRFKGTANGAFKMKAEEVSSQAEASLKIGASGYGYGFSASFLFNFKTTENKKRFLIDCTQELFTLDAEIPQGGFFQNPQVTTPDMMYVGTVTYGVRVLASIETRITSKEIAAKLDAAYEGVVAGGNLELDAYMKNFGSHTTIKMYVIGGPQQGVYPAFNQAELISTIQGIFKNGTYATAQPIKYSLRNMAGGVVSSRSATDFFLIRNCSPKPEVVGNPDYLYTINLFTIRRGNDDDWELYGKVWVQIYDALGNEIIPQHDPWGTLLDIKAENHLSSREGETGYNPNTSITFKVSADQRPGATMTIWYNLNDYDSGSGDDPLLMRNGQLGPYKAGGHFYYRRIPIDDLIPGANTAPRQVTDQFTDKDGDSYTEITSNIQCATEKR